MTLPTDFFQEPGSRLGHAAAQDDKVGVQSAEEVDAAQCEVLKAVVDSLQRRRIALLCQLEDTSARGRHLCH